MKSLNLINSFIEYPITYISDGDVVTLNKFPVNPKEWAEKKGWHTTIDIKTKSMVIMVKLQTLSQVAKR